MRRGVVDQGSTVRAPIVGCSGLDSCAGLGLWVTQERGRAQGTVQGSDVAHDRGVSKTQGTGGSVDGGAGLWAVVGPGLGDGGAQGTDGGHWSSG